VSGALLRESNLPQYGHRGVAISAPRSRVKLIYEAGHDEALVDGHAAVGALLLVWSEHGVKVNSISDSARARLLLSMDLLAM
jgi:hypothetical protein